MKSYLRILSFARPYIGNAILNAIFNILMIIFSLVSISSLIPILDMIFGSAQVALTEPPKFSFDLDAIKEIANYRIGQWIQEVGKAEALAMVCMFAAATILLKNLFNYLALYSIAPLRTGVIHNLRTTLHQKCLSLPIAYFNNKRKGDLMTRMSSDMSEIEWTMLTSLEMIVREPLNIILTLSILIYMSPSLTLFIVLVLPISGLIISTIGKSLKRSSGKAQTQLGFVMSLLEESLGGIRILKAFNAEKRNNETFSSASDIFRKQFTRVYRKKDASSPMSETLGVAVILLVMWFGGQRVFAGEMTGGSLIAYVAFFYMLIPSFKSFTNAIYNIQKGNASSERVLEILDAENPIKESPDASDVKEFKDHITFKDVHFRYESNQADILKNINFTLKKGKTIALVGSSGSGKTTISNLLPRFYDVNGGSILLDDQDIRNVKIHDLRSLLGMVSQESVLFNDSVQNNIALSKPDATTEEIMQAAKVANAHEFIKDLEKGYDTNIGEGGNKLSGGQKQRVSIARAVLDDPPILILDEATSALDTESEKLVQEALNHLMQNRTSLIIAHRLSTIQHADEILVMDKGMIVERGNHVALLAKNGVYSKLVQMQSFA